MLEQLFGSNTRMNLLQLFLSNPDEKYFVRELTRALNSQINAIRRELTNLESLGILRVIVSKESDSAEDRKRKFYQVDEKFVLYPELKSIFQKALFLLEKKFATNIQKTGKIEYLALTGHFVGEKDPQVDLLIVGKVNKKKFNSVMKKFEKNFQREINFTLLEKEEFNYRRSVADRFLYSVLDGEKIVMVDEILSKLESVDNDDKK